MIKINFYLEKRKNKNKELIVENMPIYLFGSFGGQRLQYYTGERADLKYWDHKKQRVKASMAGSLELNAFLDKLNEDVSRIYREAKIMNQPITTDFLKQKLSGKQTKVNRDSLLDYYAEFLEANRLVAKSTFKKMTTVLYHLRSFSETKRISLQFPNINDEFFTDFVQYSITNLNHTNNTIHRHLGIIKWFLRWATKKGYNDSMKFQDFRFKETETEIIALTEAEFRNLLHVELPSQKLDQVRDAFCLSCLTALRYSDLKNLKKTDVKEDGIIITAIKTKGQQFIPLLLEAKTILDKYKNTPFLKAIPVISNQKMNDYLKEIGKIARIDQPITIIRYQGNERIENTYPKYELLTTHVGRKSFISMAFGRGVRSEIIRQVSGHKNPKVFDRYNRIEFQTVEKEIKNSFENIISLKAL